MIRRFYYISAERRLRLFFIVIVLPASAVCAALHLQGAMIFALLAPFVPVFFYPECLAWAATQLVIWNRLDACNSICDYGLARFPISQGLLTAKSLVLFHRKRFEEVESETTKILYLNPVSVQSLINRSAARCYLSKFEEAEQDANLAIGLAPHWYDAYFNRANARFGRQNYEGCLEDTKSLLRLGKHLAGARFLSVGCYLMTGRLGEAETLTAGLVGNVKHGSYDALSLAMLHSWRNEFEAVLEICAQVTDLEPLAYEFIVYQAHAYFELSEGCLAMNSIARAIALDPHAENCHLLSAYILADVGYLDQAAAQCERIREGWVSTSVTRDAQSFVYWRQEQWDKMLETSDLAIERCPTSASSHSLRSLALAGLERFEESLEAGQKATGLQPLQAFGWYSLANGYLKSGQVTEALDCLNTALANNSNSRYSYQLRAQVHLQAGDRFQAAKDQAKYDELQAKFLANLQSTIAYIPAQ